MDTNTLVGQVLAGRYRIDDLLGQGSISTVYRAYDSDQKQSVLVKVILGILASDTSFQDRFGEQAKAVVELRHPNIVQVLDYGHAGDHYYLVEELVLGETLRQRLLRLNKAGKRMSIAEITEYALQIADAAGYAHQQGMLHRDIRPANILMDVHGQARLMDFGMVQLSGGHRHTATGAVMDTALYMPPEIIRGEVPDPRSDLYSLGATLYEMVSGHPPFEATAVATLLMMHLKDPLPDVRDVRSGVPAEMSSVLTRALAKDRDDRYASMADLGLALQGSVGQLKDEVAADMQATVLDEPERATEPVAFAIPSLPDGSTIAAASPAASTRAETATQPVAAATRLETASQPALAATKLESASQSVAAATRLEDTPPPSATAASMQRTRGDLPLRSVKAQPVREELGNPTPAPAAKSPRTGILGKRWLWAVVAILVLSLGAGLAVAFARGSGGANKPPENPAALSTPSQGGATPAVAAPAVAAPAVVTGTMPEGEQGMAMPGTGEAMPMATGAVSVTITSITLDANGHYVVNYQTTGLPENLTSVHLHFFFNNIPFEQAGAPYEVHWIASFGSSPFTGYTAVDRPPNASQLCVTAVNPNYTPILGTGSCGLLPGLPLAVVIPAQGIDGYFGPGKDYPVVAHLEAGKQALILGLSPDELWWEVADPDNPAQNYWVYTVDTQPTGDISKVPPAEGPPPGATPPQSLSVEITGISINSDNQYVVDFTTQGYTPALPGTHIHFYFNTFTPDQVGIGGDANRRAHAGPSPFISYSTDDRPDQATQMCAIVANPDHSVVPNSGNCFALPSLPSLQITNITVNDQQQYVVDFVAKDFVPVYPGGTHIHFYFNIFTEDQVGIGGEANRRSYGGEPPFTGYAVSERPEGATQLCGVVANPDHSVIPNSGSCSTLPGLPTVEITGITLDAQGRYVVDFIPHQFTPKYPGGTHIHFYFNTFTADQVGIGGDANRRSGDLPPFTGYAAADRPEMATQLCAIVANPNHTVIPNSGNCYHLPDVLDVQITSITVDSQNRYVVEYVTYGFTPHWPGTHVHFFFDTVKPEDLGKKGGTTNFSHGGSSPYTGYTTADRPPGATQLCAIVALPDNTVLHDSHHCFPLP